MISIKYKCPNDICYCTGRCGRTKEQEFKFKEYEAFKQAAIEAAERMDKLEKYLKDGKLKD